MKSNATRVGQLGIGARFDRAIDPCPLSELSLSCHLTTGFSAGGIASRLSAAKGHLGCNRWCQTFKYHILGDFVLGGSDEIVIQQAALFGKEWAG